MIYAKIGNYETLPQIQLSKFDKLNKKPMETFKSEFDRGEYPSDNYEVIECEVEFEISTYVPEKAYLSNGDPGYPAEGGEVEHLEVFDMDGKNITAEVPSKWLEKFTEMCYDKHDKYC